MIRDFTIPVVTTVLDCDIKVDPMHPDRWREAYECRTSDRGRGKLTFKQVILQVSVFLTQLMYICGGGREKTGFLQNHITHA